MAESGLVEFGNHTYNLHSQKDGLLGVSRREGEEEKPYLTRIASDIDKMQRLLLEKTGINTPLFTYPFGAMNKTAAALVKEMGFSVTLSCEERMNTLTRDPDSLYALGRFLRPAGESSEAFFIRVLK